MVISQCLNQRALASEFLGSATQDVCWSACCVSVWLGPNAAEGSEHSYGCCLCKLASKEDLTDWESRYYDVEHLLHGVTRWCLAPPEKVFCASQVSTFRLVVDITKRPMLHDSVVFITFNATE